MKRYPSRGFTIVELLVVVSIIALLVGILLPAIGKARDQALVTRSQANIRQLATAAQTYAAEFGDRQFTIIPDYIARYGTDATTAFTEYANALGGDCDSIPHALWGYGHGPNGPTVWLIGLPCDQCVGGPCGVDRVVPIDFNTLMGSFRLINIKNFNTYLNGRFYDPVFYAPKDAAVMASVERWGVLDSPDEFVPGSEIGGSTKYSSYCFSPAAMYNPDVLGRNSEGGYFNNPWENPAGFRSPSMSQAAYPDLKTHIIEHNQCQGRKYLCNPWMGSSVYDGCEPLYFNMAPESNPVTLFYDGHIAMRNTQEAVEADSRVAAQDGNGPGLWSRDTPQGDAGYFCADSTYNGILRTAYHIFTIDGIRGRDFIAK